LNLLRRSTTLIILLLSCASAAAIDREAFTFTNYHLQVTIDPAKPFLGVSGKIMLRNDSSAPQRIAVLQISSSLDWRWITVAGKPVQYLTQSYTSDIDHTGMLSEAVVTLPREIPPKGTVEVQVAYEGAVPQDATRLERIGTPKQIAAANEWDRISEAFTAVRGVGYVNWYPVAMEAASLSSGRQFSETLGRWKQRHSASRMAVDFAAPTGVELFATGTAGFDRITGPSTLHDISYVWERFGLDVPVFVIGKYQRIETPTLVRFLGDNKDLANRYAQVAAEVQWFSAARSERFQIVELGEASAVPFSSGGVLFTPLENLPAKELEVSLAYARTHADVPSRRLWIYEGLAVAAQAFQREKLEGRGPAISFMESRGRMLVEIEKSNLKTPTTSAAAGTGQPPSNAATSLLASFDELLARTKGMFVWWMLRDMLGERGLQNAFLKYRPEDDKEPAYMQRLLEAEARTAAPQAVPNLEQFFDDWVYRDRGLPDFRIASVYARQMLGSGYLLTVTVENLGGAGAEVPVIARARDENASRRLWVPARQKATIRIPLRSQPLEAQVNDGSVPETEMTNNTFEVRLESSP
jgi:hypothetical protein